MTGARWSWRRLRALTLGDLRSRRPSEIVTRLTRGRLVPTPRLRRYAPRSNLVVPANPRTRAAVPAVDFHNHLGKWLSRGEWMVPDVAELLRSMDECNVRAVVNLDGRWGQELEDNLDRYDRAHPGRFATFCHVDWSVCADDRFGELVTDLRRSVASGAQGLKVWKDLGRSVRDRTGRLVLPDDPRLAPLWEAVADAGLPVLIHTGDPVAHFQPVDRHNERLEELRRFPGATWHRPGLPAHRTLVDSFANLVRTHQRTTFVAAHVAGWAENLSWVGELLEANPNVSIDISARIAELGRQPRAAASLIAAHPQQVLFGSDVYPWRPEELAIYFRCLETADEHFSYSYAEVPPFGRWQISGLDLRPDLLSAVYAGNAARLLPALGR